MTERRLPAATPSPWAQWMSPILALVVVALVIQARTRDPLLLLLVGYVVASAASVLPPVRARALPAKVFSVLGTLFLVLFLAGFLARYVGRMH